MRHLVSLLLAIALTGCEVPQRLAPDDAFRTAINPANREQGYYASRSRMMYAASRGHGKALVALAYEARQGTVGSADVPFLFWQKRDTARAQAYFRAAERIFKAEAARGDADAAFELVWLYQGSKDPARRAAVQEFVAQAERGPLTHPNAMRVIGMHLWDSEHPERGLAMFEKAAATGDPHALVSAGGMFMLAAGQQGSEEYLVRAVQYFRQAEMKGLPEGGKRLREALKGIRTMAEQGNAESVRFLRALERVGLAG